MFSKIPTGLHLPLLNRWRQLKAGTHDEICYTYRFSCEYGDTCRPYNIEIYFRVCCAGFWGYHLIDWKKGRKSLVKKMNHFYWIYPRKKYHWHSKFSELGKFWRRPFWREYPFPFKLEWLNVPAVWIGTPADQTDASITRVTKGHITYFFAICNFRAKGYDWHLDWLKWAKKQSG